ncbi:mitogen-activated protein kinase kinase kinase 4 isoform X1 [Bombyx mandarina]|uniref:Mitogen-activated protein kinase kinase kinase 4 isoform X1 n=1 Tax=Bombyx mandarina TaxID=7092 RepID=A0A6J2JGA7_BOMMA|nr:mitogen-activated protein kinase kinase kinase 4 isoform X1 [Bombyx mandarina]
MDMPDGDWKKKVGFPINYDSNQSSSDEFDSSDVVMRHPRQSSRYLLADGGDGAEADLLGTTPPRSRIRDKEKRRSTMDPGLNLQRLLRDKKDSVELLPEPIQPPLAPERLKKRASLKLIRNMERDWKQDINQRESKADSLPSPNPIPTVPTLVESCSRFMSLTSRPKCRETIAQDAAETEVEERWRSDRADEVPPSRVNFHKTFSMLINMGNIEKGCRRTVSVISREEQVWQNELKDLIWLELQAKIAGRTLADQDQYLCAQRDIVPTLIKNIFEYRFVDNNPCKDQSKKLTEAVNADVSVEHVAGEEYDDEGCALGCASLECETCSGRVGGAMREVGTLLDSFYNAHALYPSSKAMTAEHPLIATNLFKNRIKAMCLWYNTALNMRVKLLAVRRMLRSMLLKRRPAPHRSSVDSDVSRQSSEIQRQCQVRFNVSVHASDSNSSDSSGHSEIKEEPKTEVRSEGSSESPAGAHRRGGGGEADPSKLNGQVTPEIVISESQYSTGEESSYSTESWSSWWSSLDPLELGPLSELTQLRLLDKCPVSLYREHHREILKTQGVRRSMMFIYKMKNNLLHKVHLTLEKPDATTDTFAEHEPVEVFEDSKNEDKSESMQDENDKRNYELRRYGWWSEETSAMRLPSYRGHFLLLSSICLEAVHDYLSFRLEARPDRPSCLTVKQLIHELKEGLDIASEMRFDFVRNVRAALASRSPGTAATQLRLMTNTYDDTVRDVLKQYLSYLTLMSETEHMSRAGLQAEWEYTARLARRIHCASQLAPLAFSEIACNQLNRLLKSFEDNFQQLIQSVHADIETNRHAVYAVCRLAQSMYTCERERTLQAAQWARALSARLQRAPPPAYMPQRALIFESLMKIRDFIVKNVEYILEQSKTTPDDLTKEMHENVVARIRELLLQIFKLGFEFHKELYKFACAAPVVRAERRPRPSSLQPRPPPRPPARLRRPDTILVHDFDRMIHKELHRFANDSTRLSLPPRRSVGGAPSRYRRKVLRTDSVLEDGEASVFDDRLFDNQFGENQTQTSIELLLSGERASDPPVEAAEGGGGEAVVEGEEVERRWAGRVARAVIQFATCWMQFVLERCDRGRGTRPRWASQGLEFLMLACDPCNTQYLTDEEFEELKQRMDSCISHVIGSRSARTPDPAPLASPRPRARLHSPLSNASLHKDVPAPPTPPSEPEPLLCFPGAENTLHSRRVTEAISRVEFAREQRLRESKSVGRVLEAAVTSYEPKLRQLTFKWQRGLKIGAGSFGKVYTVVNTESGQLLAMKELSVGAGDRRGLQRAANELRVLEGVAHPHLVRYYGCELHREEMLLFMELCVEGSLEALVSTAGALTELTVRRYTRQLVSAVVELHARNIAHRDIKSGNIFLTNEGHCLKLGDFGCAVKIRANTTAPCELQGFVGTQAYMAPEVFMKSSGHGRAADVWSLGCVVTEMASGKRPFSEQDYSNYQIMFKVGMGGRPDIPDALSDEGRDFCVACLTHDPDQRPRAETLSFHTFLMVKSDDDCQCEPAYLMT